jgi:small subunit ribosomal protein S16
MSVKIRLRRLGRNNRPFYRVVATDSRSGTQGRVIEIIGWYDPKKEGRNFSLKADRVDYWEGNGAIFSDTVSSLVKKLRKDKTLAVEAPEPVEAAS